MTGEAFRVKSGVVNLLAYNLNQQNSLLMLFF